MIKIYKKCDKNIDNPFGIVEINNLDSYNTPFLLCLSPQETQDKSFFGTIKEGARAARVSTTDEFAGGFKLSQMPIDFIGIKWVFDSQNPGKNENILDDFIYPFLKRGDIKKQARKINFFTYCNSTGIYVELEKKLKEKLLNDGYTETEVIEILSQISLISIASKVDISRIHASAILFKDVNDVDVYDSISKVAIQKMNSLNRNTFPGYIRKDGPAIFTFNGTGEHNLKEYFKDNNFVKSSLCAVTSLTLDNSVQNSKTSELIPISSKMLLQIAMKYNSEFENSKILLDRLDNILLYDGTFKYVKEEAKTIK